MASMKNELYRESLSTLTLNDILPGVTPGAGKTARHGRKAGHRLLQPQHPGHLKADRPGRLFDAVADGNQIQKLQARPRGVPAGGKASGASPEDCVVVEDAFAGIDAAKAGGMKALGVGDASRYEKADITAPTLAEIAPEKLIE